MHPTSASDRFGTPGRPSPSIEAAFAVTITNTWGQTIRRASHARPSRPLTLRSRLPALRLLTLVTGLMMSLVPSGVATRTDRDTARSRCNSDDAPTLVCVEAGTMHFGCDDFLQVPRIEFGLVDICRWRNPPERARLFRCDCVRFMVRSRWQIELGNSLDAIFQSLCFMIGRAPNKLPA